MVEFSYPWEASDFVCRVEDSNEVRVSMLDMLEDMRDGFSSYEMCTAKRFEQAPWWRPGGAQGC